MLLSSRDNKDLLVVSFTDVRRCLESGFMDLDQQAEQAQQKQTVSTAGLGSMHGQGQGSGQANDPYNTVAANQNTRNYQPNLTSATTGVLYPAAVPGTNVAGGRGGLVTYPLPSSGSSTGLKNTSAAFTPAGGRVAQSQGQRMGYSQQTQGPASSTDFSYSQQNQTQTQAQFPPYNSATVQSQTQYQQTNPYSQQGQGQQYGSQQQPYY